MYSRGGNDIRHGSIHSTLIDLNECSESTCNLLV